jgi:hypothetical protein
VACSEHDNGPSGSTGRWEFYQLSDCRLSEERSAKFEAPGRSVNKRTLVGCGACRVLTCVKPYINVCVCVCIVHIHTAYLNM